MAYYKEYSNGLRVIFLKMQGFKSVTAGILVKTGSCNETEEENGISHYIEHNLFKGTKKRSAFEISDYIDRIGAQINAFTSKEMTCYYTKSTSERLSDSMEVLSDIFFNSLFDKEETEKEKGVIIEEINMSEDTPEDLCLDLLAESYGGKTGLGQTILGPVKNIKRFTKEDVDNYMDKYYTADNVVIAIAGDVDIKIAEGYVETYFLNKFKRIKSVPQVKCDTFLKGRLHKYKKIEQAHLGLALPTFDIFDERRIALSVANNVLGGGMSSRLFQKIREEMGLSYSVYSYCSSYKDMGVMEIYAGVNVNSKDIALEAIVKEIDKFRRNGISEQEFLRGKEQIKSSFIMGQESTASMMLVYGKTLLFKNMKFDYEEELNKINSTTYSDVINVIKEVFSDSEFAVATVGPFKK